MASGQIGPQYIIAAGSNPARARELARGGTTIFDNAIGSEGYYVNGVHKPPSEGVVLGVGAGPHFGPGENCYVGVVSSTQDGIDSDDTLAVLHLQFARYDLAGRSLGTKIVTGVADRNTTTALGGLPDDPFVNVGVESMVYAFGPVPAGEKWTLYGPIRLDIRDDTA